MMKGSVTMEEPTNEKTVVIIQVENICEGRSVEMFKDISELE